MTADQDARLSALWEAYRTCREASLRHLEHVRPIDRSYLRGANDCAEAVWALIDAMKPELESA